MLFVLLVAATVSASPMPSSSSSPASTIPAPNASQPPDGTYKYQATVGTQVVIQSTIVVKHSASNVGVKEAQTQIGLQGQWTSRTDMQLTPDLGLVRYDPAYGLPSGEIVTATVTFDGKTATEQSKGHTLQLNLAASTSRFVIIDGALLSGFLLLPAQMYGQTMVTGLAPVAGFSAPLARVSDNPARPPRLPASEAYLSMIGPVPFVEWYDPTTYIVDEVDVPAQKLTMTLLSHDASTVAPSSPVPLPHSTPVSLGPQHFKDVTVSFRSSDGTRLAGTLSIPDVVRSAPSIMLLPGSGPVDRDERIGPNLIFGQIAHALANAGYAVLRFDKRGIGKSSGDANLGTRDKLLADARAALRFFKSQPRVDKNKIFLLGHSEGALLATELGGDKTLGLHGIILLGAPALPLDQILTKQAKHAPPRLIASLWRMVWFKSYLGHDPAQEIQKVTAPILISQGGRDQNVLASDTPRLVRAAKATNRDVTVLYFGPDNHEFLAGDEMTPQYVDPAMLRSLIRWLRAH